MEATTQDPTVIPCRDEEHWHEVRAEGIGGSDAPVIAGVDKYKSPYTLWAQRAEGLEDMIDESARERLEAGHFAELMNRPWYAHRHKRQVVTPQEFYGCPDAWAVVLRSKRFPWMQCTPDGIITKAEGRKGPGILQCKNVTEWLLDAWPEEGNPPIHVQAQVQHEMAVAGMGWGAIAGIIGGNKRRDADVEPHQGFLDKLIRLEKRFIESLRTGERPPLDDSEATHEALKKQYAVPEEGTSAEVELADVVELAQVSAQLDELQKREKGLKTRLMAQAKNAETLTCNGVKVATWKLKTVHQKPRAANTYSYREFRRQKGLKSFVEYALPS